MAHFHSGWEEAEVKVTGGDCEFGSELEAGDWIFAASMEISDNAEEASTDGFQVSAKKEKKKKKSRRHGGENDRVDASAWASLCPPSLEEQDMVDHGNVRKKSKKNEAEEHQSDLPPDNACVAAENELNSEVEASSYVPKKKKKKKKSRRLSAENTLVDASPSLCLASPEEQDMVDHKSVRKKSKKNQAEGEEYDLLPDNTCVAAENELNDEVEASSYVPKKKKKKKSRRLSAENTLVDASSVSLCPASLEDQNMVDHKSVRKKSKKNEAEEDQSDALLDTSWDTAENELNNEAETSTFVPKKKKKKKKKRLASEQESDAQFVVPETPEEDISENLGPVPSHTPVDKDEELPPAKQSDAQYLVPETPEKLHSLPTADSREPPVSEKAPKKRRVTAVLAKQDEPGKSSNDREDAGVDSAHSSTEELGDLSEAELTSPPQTKPEKKRPTTELGDPVELRGSILPTRLRKRARPPSAEDAAIPGAAEGAEKPAAKPKQRRRASKGRDKQQESSTVVHSDAEESSCELSSSRSLSSEDDTYESLSTQNLEDIIKQLEEFIPHVRNLAEEGIRQLARKDLARFRDFKEQGIAVKFGKFSKKENAQLRKNVKAFMKHYRVDSAEKLFFPHRFPEEQAFLKKLRKDNLFGLRIADKIPRPWRLVYYRARKVFDPLNYNGRYSEEELKKMKKYQSMYGNNWKKISELMCRSTHSIEDRYATIRSNPNQGAWTDEEVQKLMAVMKDVLWSKVRVNSGAGRRERQRASRLSHEMLFKDISWVQVEDEVGTRTWRQCKRKWFAILAQKMCGWQKRTRDLELLQLKINLIERLYELNVEDQEDVDWLEISKNIGSAPPNYVREKYHRLKAVMPNWHRRSFTEIITLLHEVKLPKLKESLEKKKSKSAEPSLGKANKRKDFFLFSEIFPDNEIEEDLDFEEEEGELSS